MKFCKYCGKSIDNDSKFCKHCGKNQNEEKKGYRKRHFFKIFSQSKKIPIGFISNIFVKLKTSHINNNSIVWLYMKNWVKRIFILILILTIVGLFILLGFWLYGCLLTSKWKNLDESRVEVALNDISQADSIARELFDEHANMSHRYDFNGAMCKFNHIEKGIEIIRYAAEHGDAKAQFTLGCIYAGARYDWWGSIKWDNTNTMMHSKIDNERAAYWYNQAAMQGITSAMYNLANSYRYGRGVKKNLIKATELMRSAAEKGHEWAQCHYGDMYRDGEVMMTIKSDSGEDDYIIRHKPDIAKAQEWWRKAMENGCAGAKERLEKIYE